MIERERYIYDVHYVVVRVLPFLRSGLEDYKEGIAYCCGQRGCVMLRSNCWRVRVIVENQETDRDWSLRIVWRTIAACCVVVYGHAYVAVRA